MPTCSWRTTSSTRRVATASTSIPRRSLGRADPGPQQHRVERRRRRNGLLQGCRRRRQQHVARPPRATTSATTWHGAADDSRLPRQRAADGWADVNAASQRNLSSDSSATRHSIIPGGPVSVRHRRLRELRRREISTSTPPATRSTAGPIFGPDARSRHRRADARSGAAWDIGADEYGGTTAVSLMSFEALPSRRCGGPRVADGVRGGQSRLPRLPGALGGRSLDAADVVADPRAGLLRHGRQLRLARQRASQNGTRYFYRLEDVDTKSVSTFHGPVSAVPGTTLRHHLLRLRRRRFGQRQRLRRRLDVRFLLPRVGSRPARLVGLLHLRDPRRPRGHVLPRPLPHLSLRPRRARDRGLPHRPRRHRPRPRPPPRFRLALRPAGARAALEARPPRRRRRPPGEDRLHPGAREPLLHRPRRRRRRLPAGRRRPRRHGATGPAGSRARPLPRRLPPRASPPRRRGLPG